MLFRIGAMRAYRGSVDVSWNRFSEATCAMPTFRVVPACLGAVPNERAVKLKEFSVSKFLLFSGNALWRVEKTFRTIFSSDMAELKVKFDELGPVSLFLC